MIFVTIVMRIRDDTCAVAKHKLSHETSCSKSCVRAYNKKLRGISHSICILLSKYGRIVSIYIYMKFNSLYLCAILVNVSPFRELSQIITSHISIHMAVGCGIGNHPRAFLVNGAGYVSTFNASESMHVKSTRNFRGF